MFVPSLTREQSRELDRRATEEYHLPSIVLMENAGRGVAERLCCLGIGGRVVICCGGGNNGGDGFVIARHLDLRGYNVHVFVWADVARLQGDAAINFDVLQRSGVHIEISPPAGALGEQLATADWIVDALLGTGARGEPRPPVADVIEAINRAGRNVLAVDLPSGLDCDTGAAASHTIRADHTCTFVAPKLGFTNPAALPHLGQVHVLDIGAPRKLVEEVISLAKTP